MTHRSWSALIGRGSAAISLVALVSASAPDAAAQPGRVNELTPREISAGWALLFDGKTFTGWRGVGYESVPSDHWTIVDGAIRKLPSGVIPRLPDGQPAVGGDLMTIATFRDFELAWQWKVVPARTAA